jgi:hypothetical protein
MPKLNMDATTRTIDGVHIHVCSIEDLKRMKQQSGRPEDLADIRALRDIQP